EWVAGISHDMRTPLSSVQRYGHILESNKYEYTSEEVREIAHVIRTKSDYMLDLLNDFSLVFKLKNSTIALKPVPINVVAYTEDIVMKFSRDMTVRSYELQFKTPVNEEMDLIDLKWLERVMDNVLSTAV